MSPKKHKLSVSIDENYCLLGISSDEPDYKLCWLINQQLRFSFAQIDSLRIFNKKLNEEQEVAIFYFDDENTLLTYRLITNRTSSGYFLSDLKNLDYLIHIQGDLKTDEINKLLKKVNQISSVRMCVPVELNKIKERDRLQLW